MGTFTNYVADTGNQKIIYVTADFASLIIYGFKIGSNQVITLSTPIQPITGEAEADFWTRAATSINLQLQMQGFMQNGIAFCDLGTPTAVLATTEVLINNPVGNMLNITSDPANLSLKYSMYSDTAITEGGYLWEYQTGFDQVTEEEFDELAVAVQELAIPVTYNQQQLWLMMGIDIA